jgi:hypothetical protein
MTTADERERKARAMLERLFGQERTERYVAAMTVPLSEAFAAELYSLPLAEWLRIADDLKARAPAEVRKCVRQRARAERNRRLRARRGIVRGVRPAVE